MRALKLTAVLGAAIILLVLLAAWQVPPRLDWNRYRGALSNIASSRMGRAVTIEGQVRLLLLPDAVLVADKVKLADRGDGVSATIGALRLRVALGPLLAGRLVPRRLELDDPLVTLPWPLPRGAAQAVPTRVAGGFTASVEGGSVHLGGVTLAGINAGVQTDPDTGAFAAQGAAKLGGYPCRFTALIGAPGADGVSTLTVTVDGQDRVQGAGGVLRGRLQAGGTVQGQLALRGPDLSRLLPAPALPWRVQGAVEAAQEQVKAPKLQLMLGESPGDASATLHIGPAPSLDVTASIGRLRLDGWGGGAMAARAPLPVRLDLSATALPLMGGVVRDGHATIALGKGPAALQARGTLPGGSAVTVEGVAGQEGAVKPAFSGHFQLATPDLSLLENWLAPLAPAVFAALPPPTVVAALSGTIAAQPGLVALSSLSGRIGGSSVSGGVALRPGARPNVTATLVFDRLALPPVAAPGWWQAAQRLAAPAAWFGGFDATLDIAAASASIGQTSVSRFALQAQGGATGLAVRRLAADLPGAHVESSFSLGADGEVADARLDLVAADAAGLALPFKLPATLWKGPLHVAVTAAGPAQDVAAQLRGDLGDLRAEAEAHLNAVSPLLKATVTLRHPGAPRLLEQAGLANAGSWLGQGSVAFLAHIEAAPAQLLASDFSLAAGALRLNGQLAADLSGATPVLTGRLDAPLLTLPALAKSPDALLPFGLLQGWQGALLLSARQITAGPETLAANATAALTVANDDALFDQLGADLAGGRLTGQVAMDTGAALPVVSANLTLTGAAVDQLAALPGLKFSGGTLDASADVTAGGHSQAALLATLNGTMQATLHGVSLPGIDLPALTRLLTARGPHLRQAVAAALNGGETGPLNGVIDGNVDNGALTLDPAELTAAGGALSVSGGIDLPTRTPDLQLRVMPAVPHPPSLVVHVAGRNRVVNAQPAMAWAGRK